MRQYFVRQHFVRLPSCPSDCRVPQPASLVSLLAVVLSFVANSWSLPQLHAQQPDRLVRPAGANSSSTNRDEATAAASPPGRGSGAAAAGSRSTSRSAASRPPASRPTAGRPAESSGTVARTSRWQDVPGSERVVPDKNGPPADAIEGEVLPDMNGPPVPNGYMVDLDHQGWGESFIHDYLPGGSCDSCNGLGCTHCGYTGGVLRGWYLRGDYLNWTTSGMDVPALVTTSPVGTASRAAGVLGQPGTSILFGNDTLNVDQRSGGRAYVGLLLDQQERLWVEGEYFALNNAETNFTATSSGTPILARPFFNLLAVQPGGGTLPQESSQLIAFPNRIGGTVDVTAVTEFQGAAARIRYLMCCAENPVNGLFGFGPVLGGYRMELTGGVRMLELDDSLRIEENLSVVPSGAIQLFDHFQTENSFVGAELGMLVQTRRGRFSMDLLNRASLGNTRGTVMIDGKTTTVDGSITTSSGGLLALDSNIGTFEQDQLSLVNEMGLNLGYQVAPAWRVIVGYTFIYWSRVLRAGQQIDREIDPNQIPPAPNTAVISPARPAFQFNWTDFWAQGVTVGLEGRW
ncbi:MAG: BBP7 family outer membrane beta-barrel protein [Planctomycetota bacterium]